MKVKELLDEKAQLQADIDTMHQAVGAAYINGKKTDVSTLEKQIDTSNKQLRRLESAIKAAEKQQAEDDAMTAHTLAVDKNACIDGLVDDFNKTIEKLAANRKQSAVLISELHSIGKQLNRVSGKSIGRLSNIQLCHMMCLASETGVTPLDLTDMSDNMARGAISEVGVKFHGLKAALHVQVPPMPKSKLEVA
ncbi:hypothetical protein ACFSJY_04045 [Thalassotalea euphylliae]|uniref:hypothetical protein n=1 Tax=Thalassotalea euphylliae TaxID=1655234 RepID=UPI00362E49F7